MSSLIVSTITDDTLVWHQDCCLHGNARPHIRIVDLVGQVLDLSRLLHRCVTAPTGAKIQSGINTFTQPENILRAHPPRRSSSSFSALHQCKASCLAPPIAPEHTMDNTVIRTCQSQQECKSVGDGFSCSPNVRGSSLGRTQPRTRNK